jgi:hypothetical protein
MIIVRLRGGLGNQLFQYAFARALSVRMGVEVRLDAVSSFKSDFFERKYALGSFDITLPLASVEEIRRFGPSGLAGRARLRMGSWAALLRQPTIGVEKDNFRYDQRFLDHLDPDRDHYLIGFWQAEQYLKPATTELRRDLRFNHPMNEANAAWAQRISSTQAVSVHVRRHFGSSVSGRFSNRAASYHGSSSADYYRRSLDRLFDVVPSDAELFIFGDDPHWAVEHILDRRLNYHVIAHNGFEKDYEDLRLMSLCKHHIIANSTFSWWGAWLNPDPGKIVIAPREWLADHHATTDDLIPDEWHRL